MKKRIYLDNNASTPIDPIVKEQLIATLDLFGNASSLHEEGRRAKGVLTEARATIAKKLKVKPAEVIFTSCGTESMVSLIFGVLNGSRCGHVISSTVEHACVMQALKRLEEEGVAVTYLKPESYGGVTLEQVQSAIRPDTRLITLMAANNETGILHPVNEIANIAKERRIPFLVDAVCAFGKCDFSIVEGMSGVGFSGHKFHAPKGVGFFYLNSRVPFTPLFVGGEQELGKRGGSVAVPLIAALAEAVELSTDEEMFKTKALRDEFEQLVLEKIPGVEVNGEGPRNSNTSNLYFNGVEGELLLQKLDMEGIACSHGSACASGALEPSKVLLGMGYNKERAGSSLRFSFSRLNTLEEVYTAVGVIEAAVRTLR